MKGCMSHPGSLALTSLLGVFIADERLFLPVSPTDILMFASV